MDQTRSPGTERLLAGGELGLAGSPDLVRGTGSWDTAYRGKPPAFAGQALAPKRLCVRLGTVRVEAVWGVCGKRMATGKALIRVHLPTSCPGQEILRFALQRIPRLVT